MDIQRGEKKTPPNPSHHPKATFLYSYTESDYQPPNGVESL